MMRIILFMAVNLAVVLIASVTLSLLGVGSYLEGSGLNYSNLMVFCVVFGFAGAFVSLFLSRWMAKRSMGVKVIQSPESSQERWLVETTKRLCERANIPTPEIGLYHSPHMNAFATGATKKSSLIAVSTGLLDQMSQGEAEAVIAHEVAHIANGDMITLTLIQGVVNAFVMFLARIVGFFVDRVILKNEEGYGLGFFVATIVAELVLGFLASTIVMWFSRRREFYADAGSAKLVGKQNMIAALERLNSLRPEPLPDEMMAFGISGGRSKFGKFFMSHPPIEARIRALQSLT